jgi:hypothetical protein
MSEHVEQGPAEADGSVPLKVWYDDPEHEDPNYGQDGESLMYDGGPGRDAWLAQMYHHLERLHMMARAKLGAGKVYEIRSKIPTNFGRNIGIAWYTVQAMQALDLVAEIPYPGEYCELGGYFFMGRFRS